MNVVTQGLLSPFVLTQGYGIPAAVPSGNTFVVVQGYLGSFAITQGYGTPALPPVVPPVLPPVPVPVPTPLWDVDADTLAAVVTAWSLPTNLFPGADVDDDTLAAAVALWTTAPVPNLLPALFSRPPEAGRLHGPQALPYAHVSSELARRESAGTGGAWHDVRKVTVTVRGLKADVVAAVGAAQAVFNRDTVLTYPSGARFIRWWPLLGPKLEQDPTTKEGQDLWTGILEAEVWSIRTQ